MSDQLISNKDKYIKELFTLEDNTLKAVWNSAPKPKQTMQISPEDGRLLNILVQLTQAKKILEIGTFVGYSTIWLARGLMPGGILYSIEKSNLHYNIAKNNIENSDLNNKVTLICGHAQTALAELTSVGPFDVVFIDADKVNYNIYLDFAEINLRTGGLIIADNTLLFDTVYQDEPINAKSRIMWHEMRKFNHRLSDNKKFNSILIPTKSGLCIAIKK